MNLTEARMALSAGEDTVSILRRVWHLLDGGDRHAMAAYKLERIAKPAWRDPVVTFEIEQHGDLDGEVQKWRADLAAGTAQLTSERPLRMRPSNDGWDERPVAAELARAMNAGADDPRLEWRDGRRRAVKVLTTKALPPGSRATTTQSNRLRSALAEELGDSWTREMGMWVKT